MSSLLQSSLSNDTVPMLQNRRVERMKYIALHSKRLRALRMGGKPDSVVVTALLKLEKALPVEMILFYRRLSKDPGRTLDTRVPRCRC